ncbi:hypothetical protein XM38_050280 [Halomicronema hongdechloris C2206]|uniref:Uncharacterized protein n=1 Tax=Halomicronema hongdechloris C2206 TaxID=1641165 RepID=A0A1Z3HUR8_9CYAN|nr:hypothetical protein [Halomicronema hongdechloris]ASC74054.1 hypothetical protein XM38_050280 [Halomicronema hongdechloris C2206]
MTRFSGVRFLLLGAVTIVFCVLLSPAIAQQDLSPSTSDMLAVASPEVAQSPPGSAASGQSPLRQR